MPAVPTYQKNLIQQPSRLDVPEKARHSREKKQPMRREHDKQRFCGGYGNGFKRASFREVADMCGSVSHLERLWLGSVFGKYLISTSYLLSHKDKRGWGILFSPRLKKIQIHAWGSSAFPLLWWLPYSVVLSKSMGSISLMKHRDPAAPSAMGSCYLKWFLSDFWRTDSRVTWHALSSFPLAL